MEPEMICSPTDREVEDEEFVYEEGGAEEGNDMDSTWKAIMEAKKKTLLMESQLRPSATPPAAPLYSSKDGRDSRKLVQLNSNNSKKEPQPPQLRNKCPPPPQSTVQLRRTSGGGSGGSGGRKKRVGGGGGWRRNVMEELVTGQDELYHHAEAFINRFKNGIQLQRLESYQRFLEIINR